ncbi:MAG: serine/threonine-protein kinase [Planctomycetota bacterium]
MSAIHADDPLPFHERTTRYVPPPDDALRTHDRDLSAHQPGLATSLIAHLQATNALHRPVGVSLPPDCDVPPDVPPEVGSDDTLAMPLPRRGKAPDATIAPGLHDQPSPAQLPIGAPVGAGRYTILGMIGRGGMGTVLKVYDQDLRRQVAMKVLNPDAVHSGENVLERFIEEAQIPSQLQHPHILPVYDIGMAEGGYVYYTMKLVGGRSFGEILSQPRCTRDGLGSEAGTQREGMDIFRKIASAIAYAHAKGVVHRDLKPENVMVGRFGEVLVMDWGLARVLPDPGAGAVTAATLLTPDGIGGLNFDQRGKVPAEPAVETVRKEVGYSTRHGSIAGTPAWMSPEQAAGRSEHTDRRTDVWALGAILYAMLVGHPPHLWDSPGAPRPHMAELLRRTREEDVRPLRRANRERLWPRELEALLARALARSRDARFADASELLAALENFEDTRLRLPIAPLGWLWRRWRQWRRGA